MLTLSVVLAGVVATRAALQAPDGIHLESYLATLAAVSLPLVLVGAVLARNAAARAAFVLAAAALAGIVVAGENRAAAVALGAAALAALAQALRWGPRRRLAAAAGAAALLAAGVWLATSDHAARFRSLWNPQAHAGAALDRGTAAERLEIWRAGWEMAVDHPLLGVGPGNFQALLPMYRPGMDPLAGHSNYVQMLAETGFPGLLLYLAVFVAALLALGRVASVGGGGSQAGTVARLLQIALVAYLAGGAFNSRHDLVLAYVVVGWCIALTSTRERPA
jgi:O-antigen ligase